MTVDLFVKMFPEFKGVSAEQIQLYIDGATLMFDEDQWGEKLEQGIAYLTADRLALSPFGNNVRLKLNYYNNGSSPLTPYAIVYQGLCRIVSSGFRVC